MWGLFMRSMNKGKKDKRTKGKKLNYGILDSEVKNSDTDNDSREDDEDGEEEKEVVEEEDIDSADDHYNINQSQSLVGEFGNSIHSIQRTTSAGRANRSVQIV